MVFEDVLEEYLYHCLELGYTRKTMINKRQDYKHLKLYLKEIRAITELEIITAFDLRAYYRIKQQAGLPQSIVSMYKMIAAFFNWGVKEGYLRYDRSHFL